MNGIRVTWTTADTVRAQEQLEKIREDRFEEYSKSRAAQYLYGSFGHWLDSNPSPIVPDYVTHHKGRVLSFAFQPAQIALAKSDRGGTCESKIAAGWVALVVCEDGRIVSMNPLDLREDTTTDPAVLG